MITQGSQMVLNFLKRNYGTEFTKKEIAEGAKVSFNTVNGSIRGLVQKGYVDERTEEVVIPATELGKKDVVETIRYETLNEAGLAYDPEQEDLEQKEREREKRKAKRNKQAE